MPHDKVGQRSVQDGRRVELLAGDGRANYGENAGSDHCPDAQRGQRPWTQRLFQPVFRLLRVGDQLVDGLTREDLCRQSNAPGSAEVAASGLNQKPAAAGK